jgi:DNA mismatch repair protein MutS
MLSPFGSILFDREVGCLDELEEPDCFGDLHLDQILATLTAGREQYSLEPFFYRPLHDVEAVNYRHHVLRDLEQESLLDVVREFARQMHRMREHLTVTHQLYYARQKQRWFLDAVAVYCEAVRSLSGRLGALELRSQGFLGLREHLATYTGSDRFTTLVTDTKQRAEDLAAITYAVQIKGSRIRVAKFENEPDFSAEVEHTFAKFKRGAASDYRVRFRGHAGMNHVEAQILDLVARLYPDTFAKLDQYCDRHRAYLDETIGRFDREVQFYLAYLEYIAPLTASGLRFTYPRVSVRAKEERADQAFDVALALKLSGEHGSVVCNDFHLTGPERVLAVSGPNNGGKTTFARMFGQLHYLASLGLPVPAASARLLLPDRVFTHFEREEDIETLRGKFEDELFRIHEILGSTTLHDALAVGSGVMEQILDLGALCVFVTFVDELASFSEGTVSMMSTVVPDDPAIRTFKVVRKPADGLAYASAIADKYGLTYAALRRRITR